MENLDTLKKIHKSVFKKFKYKLDSEQYGEEDKWVMPHELFDGTTKIVGDCEDFSLACRKLCRDAGIQTRLVYCLTETGEGHCVLEYEGWILDNRQKAVTARDKLKNYVWLAISGYNSGDLWEKIVG